MFFSELEDAGFKNYTNTEKMYVNPYHDGEIRASFSISLEFDSWTSVSNVRIWFGLEIEKPFELIKIELPQLPSLVDLFPMKQMIPASPLEQFDEWSSFTSAVIPAILLCLALDYDHDDIIPLVADDAEELDEELEGFENNFDTKLVDENVGYEGPVVEFLAVLFNLFIAMNILGLTPGVGLSSAQIQYVLPLAILCFILIVLTGFYCKGVDYAAMFFPSGVPVLLAPMLVAIELLSYVARPLSLGIRMFANMMAGHALLGILLAFIAVAIVKFGGFGLLAAAAPIAIILMVCVLEFAVAILQSYVFIILLCIYLREVAAPSH